MAASCLQLKFAGLGGGYISATLLTNLQNTGHACLTGSEYDT